MVGPRELEQGTGRQSAAVPRIKFHGAGISGAPGGGPGGEYLGQQLGEIFMPRTTVTMAVYPSSSPDIVRFTVFCQARKYKGEVQAGGPAGAPILLRVYLPTAEANEKGASAQISRGSHEPTVQNHLEMATIFG